MKKSISIFVLINILAVSAFAQIAVNQVGYLPNSQKFVYFSNPAKSFSVVEKNSDKVVFQGKTELWKSDDPSTGHTIYKADFSELLTPGNYYIKSEKGEKSYTFAINNSVFNELYNKSLKTFYIQRCGIKLDEKYAGKFAHKACHLNKAHYHSDTKKTGTREVSGGWHDAGDYGRYIVNGAYSVAVMFSGYEFFPDGFQSDDIGIPESGNGIPDFLDEMRYELEWMFKMQDDDGGLFHKVTEPAFQTLDLKPENDEKPQIIVIKTTTATADFAVVMAQAGRIFKKYDKKFANKCKKAALKAWKYLEENPNIIPENGFKNPKDIHTGQYGDRDDRDERLWAAVEMYRTFKKNKYNEYFKTNIKEVNLFPNEIAWRDVAPFAIINYIKYAKNSGNRELKQFLIAEWKNFCDKMFLRQNNDGYQALLIPGDYRWGSLQINLNFGFILLAGAYEFENNNFKNAAIGQINFILGANGLNKSFVTGFGENAASKVHNRICSLTNNWEIYPGFLVGGPNENLEDSALRKKFSGHNTPGLCYLDSRDSYASNETCINWNAILVVYAGYLNGLK